MLTETVRKLYHHNVVLNHALRGTAGYKPICNHRHPTVAIPREGSGVWVRPAHPLTTEAWNAYIQVMRHHGETMPGAGGLGNCRNIGGTNKPSLHAYLCALDLPPNNRKSAAFLKSIKAIRTNNGKTVFRNLWGDRMHDQINCRPVDLATGIDWTTVVGDGDEIGVDMWLHGLDIGNKDEPSVKDPRVGTLQALLVAEGYNLGSGGPNSDGVDGAAGNITRSEFHDWKIDNGITAATSAGSGVVGDYEAAVMLTGSGEQGEKGDQGDRGFDGQAGVKGDQGIQGRRGERGSSGEDGEDGKPASLTISGDQVIP